MGLASWSAGGGQGSEEDVSWGDKSVIMPSSMSAATFISALALAFQLPGQTERRDCAERKEGCDASGGAAEIRSLMLETRGCPSNICRTR